ncbi:MAG: GDSL-type esterase/lipase family protein [Myxococcota bacterium]
MRALSLFFLVAAARPAMADALAITVGDSIVQTYSPDQYPWIQGWGADVQKHFLPAIRWENDARGGQSTKSFVDQGLWASTLAAGPQFVLIQLGTNDWNPDPAYHTDPDTTYRTYLHQMILDARAIGAEPILVTPTAMRYTMPDGIHVERPSTTEPWASAMAAQAADDGVAVIDMQNWTLDTYDSLGMPTAQALYGFTIPGTETPDILHFSPYGANQAAQMVVNRLPAASPSLALYLATSTVPALPAPAAAVLVAALGLVVVRRSMRA